MELNNASKHVLKYIYKHPYVISMDLTCMPHKGINRAKIDDILQNLIDMRYISCRSASCPEADTPKADVPYDSLDCYLILSPEGEAYVESLKQDSKRVWIPVIISSILSLIAIIISVIALLKP